MDTSSIKVITSNLKGARLKKQFSQSELAAKLAIPQSHISKIESGKINPTLGMVIEIARVLDFELMLIPKKYVIPVEALLQAKAAPSANFPAYTLNDDDKDA